MPIPAGEKVGVRAARRLVHTSHVSDDVYHLARQHFSEKELVDLTMAIVAINGWNRLVISSRQVAGTYQPTEHAKRVAAARA